jgi:hypothetical protein
VIAGAALDCQEDIECAEACEVSTFLHYVGCTYPCLTIKETQICAPSGPGRGTAESLRFLICISTTGVRYRRSASFDERRPILRRSRGASMY